MNPGPPRSQRYMPGALTTELPGLGSHPAGVYPIFWCPNPDQMIDYTSSPPTKSDQRCRFGNLHAAWSLPDITRNFFFVKITQDKVYRICCEHSRSWTHNSVLRSGEQHSERRATDSGVRTPALAPGPKLSHYLSETNKMQKCVFTH